MEVIILLLIAGVLYLFWRRKNAPAVYQEIPAKWKTILTENVLFYKALSQDGRKQFEWDVQRFLADVRITGVKTEVTIEDRLLVASGAVIPLFGFPAWTYSHLGEVLLYPGSFDRNYVIGSTEEIITGMVGTGPMEGKMILSKPALRQGFANSKDKRNVGIHEFVHLFDKEDGVIDGVPPGYEEKEFALPWIQFIQEKTKEIVANKSDIDGYATTNRQEFFAVAGEYFFERPQLLKKKHPELYETLSQVFNQQLAETIDVGLTLKKSSIGRNQKCPCGSGLKYKRCCID